MIIRASAKPDDKETAVFIQQTAICKFLMFLLLLSIISLLNIVIWQYPWATIIFTLTVIPLRCLTSTISSFMTGRGRVVSASWCQVSARVLLAGFIWMALVIKKQIFYAIAAHFMVEILLMMILWIISDIPNLFSRSRFLIRFMDIFRESAEVGVTLSGITLVMYQPLFWMQSIAPEISAIYGLTIRVIELLFIPFNAIVMILFPDIAAKHDQLNLKSILLKVRNYRFYIAITSLLLILLLIPRLHLFKWISLPLSPLDAAIPYIVLCSFFYLVLQLFTLALFLKKQLQIVMMAAIYTNMIQVAIFALPLTRKAAQTLLGNNMPIILVMLSFIMTVAFIIIKLKWREGRCTT